MKASTLRILLWLVFLPIAAFCVWQFVDFVFMGGQAQLKIPTQKEISNSLKSTPKPVEQIRRQADFYKPIADVNISGVPPKKAEALTESRPVEKVEAIKINPLKEVLAIRGVRVDGDSPADSLAFVLWKDTQISADDRKKLILREGQMLPKPYHEKFKVKTVRVDSVVFLDVIKKEDVILEVPKLKTVGAVGLGGIAGTASQPAGVPRRANYTIPTESVRKSEMEYWVSPADHKEMQEKGLEMIGRDIQAVTYLDPKTRRPVGLKVSKMRPDSLASKLGIKENDIVREIGGIPMRSTADVYEYAKQNPDVKEVVISIERFGRMIPVTYVLP